MYEILGGLLRQQWLRETGLRPSLFSRPYTGLLCLAFPTQDFILGYIQSSLRDWGARRLANILDVMSDALH